MIKLKSWTHNNRSCSISVTSTKCWLSTLPRGVNSPCWETEVNVSCEWRASVLQVDWEHNDTKVTISGPRGGVSIHTEAGGRVVTSRLSVVRAAPPDAGNYTCHPHSALPATTTVYIVDGKCQSPSVPSVMCSFYSAYRPMSTARAFCYVLIPPFSMSDV